VLGRLAQLAAWALAGAALTYFTVALLGELGLALVLAGLIGGLTLAAARPPARSERFGLLAGPGLVFIVAGELDDAPGLVLIGLTAFAAAALLYVSGSSRRKRTTGLEPATFGLGSRRSTN
jgi:hypothetical protein